MVIIESCENKISRSNGVLMVLDGHATEVSSNSTMSNKVVNSQDPERIDETKECLVQRKVSLRLQNQAKVKYGSNEKRSMCHCNNENKFVQKKTKLNPSKQQVFQICGDSLVSNYTNAFPQGMDIQTILRCKEILRVLNIRKLQSAVEEHNRCKSEERNNPRAAEFSRRKTRSARGKEAPKVLFDYPWYAINKQGYDFLSLVCKDISNGQEHISIPVINEYDVPPIAPTGFTYIKSLQISKKIKVPSKAVGCGCKRSCTRTKTCSCVNLNGSIPYMYDSRNGARLIAHRKVVFECGPNCGCGPDCGNRVSQRGLKFHLEVFRTPNKGWGVRTIDNIPAGAPICEYIGVLCRSEELDNDTNNEYIFDIDCKQKFFNEIEGREELTYDYGYKLDSVVGPDGNIKQLPCNCGEANCRKRLH